jgi:hypothetical protein
VSLAGYACSGAFLGLAYFDFLYSIVALVVVLHEITVRSLAEANAVPVPSLPPAGYAPQLNVSFPQARDAR